MVKKHFGEVSRSQSGIRREGLTNPRELAEKGIATKESLDWLAARSPKEPAAEHHIDSASVRQEAVEEAQATRRALINRMRAEFRGKSAKTKRDFGTARDYRGQDRAR